MAKNKPKKRKASVELTLWDVILSYPDLHDPKPFKGKIYYRTDCLLDSDHPQLKELRVAVSKVKKQMWGEDKAEWPEDQKALIQNGDTRQDQKPYHGKFFVTASTQNPVPVVDLRGKAFNAQSVKGGMTANVAINISGWQYDGDEGVSIYLQGVQVDTTKERLQGFGGGRSVSKMFDINTEEGEEYEEEDNKPRGQTKGKKDAKSEGKKSKKSSQESDDQEEEENEEDEKPRSNKRGFRKLNRFDEEE